jgi:ADP-ribosylglycohydrolase
MSSYCERNNILAIEDRARGAFFGNLIGDALGAPVEFQERDSYPEVRDMIYCETFRLPAGSFTDDGSMMLCLAASLANTGGVQDPANVLSHYLAWYIEGYMSSSGSLFDIGRTTRDALDDYRTYGRLVARTDAPYQAGNGSVMRIAPIPIMFGMQTLSKGWAAGEESSKTTHTNAEAIWGCGLWAVLTGMAIRGYPKEQLLAFFDDIPHSYVGSIARYTAAWDRVVRKEFLTKSRNAISSSGFVVDTVEAALWAFFGTDTFEDGLIKVVNLGKDTDTVGAVYGILAGAYYGVSAIPDRWMAALQKRQLVEEVWADLWEVAGPLWTTHSKA